MKTTENSNQLDIESTKQITDYLKHITTLSTGSIVLLVAFLEKLFSKPEGTIFIKYTMVGFAVSVVGAVIAMTINIAVIGRDRKNWEAGLGGIGLLLCWLGFLVAILSLSIFAIKNIG